MRAELTQEALDEVGGLGRRSIQRLERGENIPHRGTRQRLIRAFVLLGAAACRRSFVEPTAFTQIARRPITSVRQLRWFDDYWRVDRQSEKYDP